MEKRYCDICGQAKASVKWYHNDETAEIALCADHLGAFKAAGMEMTKLEGGW